MMNIKKPLLGFASLIVVCIAAALLVGSPTHAQAKKQIPLIIDTDMGTDDWLAIAYIAQNAHVDLRGITIVGNGLASCAYASQNAQYLLSKSTRNANKPVGCGSNWPLDGFASYPKIWRETGADMMGEKKPGVITGKQDWDGPTLLAHLLRESQEPVDILAIGSMTNIATAIRAEPNLKSKIRRIISMGGAVTTGGNLRVHGFTDHHPNTKAEWNYYIDPVAAKIVFESGVQILLVPLDATNKVPLTKDFISRLDNRNPNPLEAFAHRIFKNIVQSTTNGEYFHWDPLTAAIAAHPELCDLVNEKKLTVVTDKGRDTGLPNGQPKELFPLINAVGQKRNALSESAAGATVLSERGQPIQVCMHVEAAKFENNFIETLRATN